MTFQGLHYIHSSAIEYHGALTAGACLVDSRWTVKLSDFGLQSMLTLFSANKILTESNESKLKAESKSGLINHILTMGSSP